MSPPGPISPTGPTSPSSGRPPPDRPPQPGAPRSARRWLERVRALRDRAAREREGACFVEGIRQVLSALEGGHPLEALLVDPTRLRSSVAWEAVERARQHGAIYVELRSSEFEHISARDNPVGIAAIVRWRTVSLAKVPSIPDGVYLVTDDVHDPGNLGTLIRTLDAAGGTAVIIHGGTDPTHPNALRAGLGTTFRLPVASVASLDEFLDWSACHHITTVATSARSAVPLWEAPLARPAAVVVGSEGAGLSAETLARCDLRVSIPMLGTATSLNVSVAAGIVLYELVRTSGQGRAARGQGSDVRDS